MKKAVIRDDGMLLDEIGISGDYHALRTNGDEPTSERTASLAETAAPNRESNATKEAADMDELVRTLKDQGAEIIFEGRRPDGGHRRF